MKQVFKRLLSLSLAVLLVAVLLPAELVTHAYASDYVQLTGLADQAQTVSSPAIQPQADASTSTPATFRVGGQTYTDLGDAIAAAQSGTDKTIVVATDGALTGSYTIPAGVTLLVPFDAAATLYKETPTATRTAAAAKAYRKLVLAADAALTVEGAISVGGQYYSAGGSEIGGMVGNYGHLWLNTGAAITVKSGGALYAWGFVSGNGAVAAESGAKVYEWFQIGDFRGGRATMCISNRVFPFSQYFIQNIESPLTIYSGAEEILYTDIYASSSQNGASVTFIGNSGMFKVLSGSLTKQYDPAQDRMVYTVDGKAELNSLSINSGALKVDSSEYVLPITNNMTLHITPRSSITTNQDIALLPGVQVYVDKAAELTIAAGKKAYIYDSDQWTDQNYVNPNAKFKSVLYSPTKSYTRTNADLVDALVDVNGTLIAAGEIYTTKSGADVCSSQKTGRYIMKATSGTETITYQYTQSGSSVTAHNIGIDPIRLKNDDGSYTATKGKAQDQYNFEVDKWLKCQRLLVIFDPNYTGAPEIEVQKVAPSTATPLLSNPFTREGYNFTGWTTEANGSGTSYADGANITLTADTTLYAQWSCSHAITEVRDAKDATCTEPGYTGDTYCTVCNEKVKEGEVIPAKGHTEEIRNQLEPTLTTPGYTGDKYCKVCGVLIEKGEVIPCPTGWLESEQGRQYYKNGEPQKTGWTVIDGNTYYLDTETGYAATGIATLVPDGATEVARCVFDANGVFQSNVTGVYSVGNDTYWLNSGIIEEEAGLKRVVKENGEVNYYYFAVQKNLEEREGLTLSAAVKSTVLNGKDCWLHKTNGLALPEWGYYFDENGIILHDEDTGKNGILKDGEDLYYYVDGIKAPAGMIKIGNDYYYANSKGKLIVNQTYYCSRMNGLMEEGTYAFDAEGKLIPGATDKNGIVKDDDGVLRYYVNGKVTYVGLIEIDGDFYYVRSSGEVVTNCVYWITWTHGLKEAGYYTFDESGKLTGTPKNGIVEEDGVLHYYVNGKLTYAGLIKIGDDYYYVNSKCEVVHDCDYTITWTHGLLPQGRYHFDADGKLTGSVAPLKNGIYEEDGSLYFYRNGERTYAGLIQIDGDYYYVRSTCEVVHDRSYYVYWTHGLMPEGYYNFDSAGRMILDSETE
jgi:uncharacterized repeat protein (TIGR02543 family)